MRRRLLLLGMLVVFSLGSVAAAWAGASANYTIEPSVMASGGAVASSANYAVASTVGQPAIGQGASAAYALCSGFWCPAQQLLAELYLFLPVIQRQ